MSFLQSLVLAFSMFSALPMPFVAWNERNMQYMMCAFPLVGVAIGCFAAFWLAVLPVIAGVLCRPVSPRLAALGLLLIPVLTTGGIHLDGFMDTADALGSHANREKKLAIMKDSHVGSFAVIGCVLYMLSTYVVLLELCRGWLESAAAGALAAPVSFWRWFLPFGAVFAESRLLSAFAVAVFPAAKSSGLVHTFATASARRFTAVWCGLWFVLLSVALVWVCGRTGFAGPTAALCVLACYYMTARRAFGGITGDTAGWFVCLCELVCTAAAVLC